MDLSSARLILTPNISPSELSATPSLQICSKNNVVYERVCTVNDGSGWPAANDGGIRTRITLTNLPEVELLLPLKDQLRMVL